MKIKANRLLWLSKNLTYESVHNLPSITVCLIRCICLALSIKIKSKTYLKINLKQQQLWDYRKWIKTCRHSTTLKAVSCICLPCSRISAVPNPYFGHNLDFMAWATWELSRPLGVGNGDHTETQINYWGFIVGRERLLAHSKSLNIYEDENEKIKLFLNKHTNSLNFLFYLR